MTVPTPDWITIRHEYEQGECSLRKLASSHGVSKTSIIERRDREGWNRPTTNRPPTDRPSPPRGLPTGVSTDAISIAKRGLHQLAQHLQTDTPLDIKEHKLLSDALAQYVKVLVIAPQEESSEAGLMLDIGKLPAWKRMELRRLLAADEPQREVM